MAFLIVFTGLVVYVNQRVHSLRRFPLNLDEGLYDQGLNSSQTLTLPGGWEPLLNTPASGFLRGAGGAKASRFLVAELEFLKPTEANANQQLGFTHSISAWVCLCTQAQLCRNIAQPFPLSLSFPWLPISLTMQS